MSVWHDLLTHLEAQAHALRVGEGRALAAETAALQELLGQELPQDEDRELIGEVQRLARRNAVLLCDARDQVKRALEALTQRAPGRLGSLV